MRAKLAIVEEELDESLYWIQMLIDADLLSAARADDLLREANEILAMTVASIRTLRTSRVAQ
jgi:four helix bundle protein